MKPIRVLDCIYCKRVSINTADDWIQTYVCDDCYEKNKNDESDKETDD